MHWILKESRRKPNQTTQVEDGNEDKCRKCMENARENENYELGKVENVLRMRKSMELR